MTFKKIMLVGSVLLSLLAFPGTGVAGVSIDISLPPLAFPGPPSVVVIPGTYVYFSPDTDMEIYFYQGYWYRPYGGRWYRGTSYNGPWRFHRRVPHVLYNLPRDFRAREFRSREYRHIPYGELHRNWRTWERDKYWEKHGWGRHDLDRERRHGVAPPFKERGKEKGRHEERERHDHDRGRERGR